MNPCRIQAVRKLKKKTPGRGILQRGDPLSGTLFPRVSEDKHEGRIFGCTLVPILPNGDASVVHVGTAA